MIAIGGSRLAHSPALPRRSLSLTSPELGALVRDVVSVGTGLWIRASGPSMSPTIRDADGVLLAPISPPRLGQIVLVAAAGRTVLHRIVAIHGTRIQTRGDASLVLDEPVSASRLLARAIARERRGRVTALAWAPELGVMANVRGVWWWLRHRLAGLVRVARGWRPASEKIA